MAGPRAKHLALPIPSVADFHAYKGGHTPLKWAEVGPYWHCPSCLRSKYEQLTWTQRKKEGRPVVPTLFFWLAPITEHHDHGADFGRGFPRFLPTYICADCNLAEGFVKRKLRLPPNFSFSVSEMRLFITGHPHRRVTEDLNVASQIAIELLGGW